MPCRAAAFAVRGTRDCFCRRGVTCQSASISHRAVNLVRRNADQVLLDDVEKRQRAQVRCCRSTSRFGNRSAESARSFFKVRGSCSHDCAHLTGKERDTSHHSERIIGAPRRGTGGSPVLFHLKREQASRPLYVFQQAESLETP